MLARPRREQLARSYRLKQSVHELQRLVAAQRDQFHQRTRGRSSAWTGLTQGSRPYLRDVGDHLIQIAGEFQRQTRRPDRRSPQTYFNANSDRLNAVATRLTDRRHDLRRLHRRDRLLRPELRLAREAHQHAGRRSSCFGVGGLVVPTVILLTLFWVKRHDWF